MIDLVDESATNRTTAPTSLNGASSRSHAMLLLRVVQLTPVRDISRRVAFTRGLLSIVDLSGSERVSKSGLDGARLAEAKQINKSIASLGEV